VNAEFTYILVPSTSHALRIEKHLAAAGITCKLVPVPRHLSSDCGVCVRLAPPDRRAAETLLLQQALDYDQVVNTSP